MQGFRTGILGLMIVLLVIVPSMGMELNDFSNITEENADVLAFHSIDNASLALYEGQNALQAGRYEEALAAYTNATRYDPSFMAAWYLKAYSLMKLGRNDEALVAVDRALLLDPADRDSNNLKADILEKLGKHDEASKYRITPVPSAPATLPVTTATRKAPLGILAPVAAISGIFVLNRLIHPSSRDTRSPKEGKE